MTAFDTTYIIMGYYYLILRVQVQTIIAIDHLLYCIATNYLCTVGRPKVNLCMYVHLTDGCLKPVFVQNLFRWARKDCGSITIFVEMICVGRKTGFSGPCGWMTVASGVVLGAQIIQGKPYLGATEVRVLENHGGNCTPTTGFLAELGQRLLGPRLVGLAAKTAAEYPKQPASHTILYFVWRGSPGHDPSNVSKDATNFRVDGRRPQRQVDATTLQHFRHRRGKVDEADGGIQRFSLRKYGIRKIPITTQIRVYVGPSPGVHTKGSEDDLTVLSEFA